MKQNNADNHLDIAIEVKDLSFQYHNKNKNVLNKINFIINKGEYVAIVGHNGSGKSTLSKLLIGILKPSEGKIIINGKELINSNIHDIRKNLGIVFQNPDNQFIGSTVADDIAFGLENRQIENSNMKDMVIDSAKKVNMEQFLDSEPLSLSGGQKQRVAIASTLALSADILLFDEATSMLDSHGKEEIKKIMYDLKYNENKTIISITHDMEEILKADKIIVLNNGNLAKVGNVKEVIQDISLFKEWKLNPPFIINMINSLRKEGLDIKDTFDIDKLVNDICKN